MESVFSPAMFSQLSELFSEAERATGAKSRESNPSGKTEGVTAASPADLYGTAARIDNIPIPKPKTAAQAGDIFDDDDCDGGAIAIDDRPEPEYEIRFAQSLSANDAYLGLDPTKMPGASGCDRLVVIIQLPLCKERAELALDVNEDSIDLRHPSYRLHANLPEPVVKGKGSAQWDADKRTLRVELVVDTTRRILKIV